MCRGIATQSGTGDACYNEAIDAIITNAFGEKSDKNLEQDSRYSRGKAQAKRGCNREAGLTDHRPSLSLFRGSHFIYRHLSLHRVTPRSN